MDLGLKNRKAILIGATSGIGLATAHVLASEGCDIALCSRSQANVDAAISALGEYGTKIVGASVNVLDAPGYISWIEKAIDELEGCDIFISFASQNTMQDDEEGWRATFESDAMPLVRGVKTVVPALQKSDAAAIVVISSSAAIEEFMGPGGYHALKAAAINYSAALSQKLGPEGIRVNCVTPGPIFFENGGWQGVKDAMPEFFDATVKNIPIGRMGTGQEIGTAIAFVASPACRYMTGANIVVDGGFTKRVQF